MSNEEESLLALLCESLSNGQRGNAPIFINFNSFNAPVGQHNDHVDTVNFSMDKDGGISFQHVRRTGKSIIQPEVMAKALEKTMEEALLVGQHGMGRGLPHLPNGGLHGQHSSVRA